MVFGCIQQAIDIIASCIEYKCTPYIRYPVSLHYVNLLSENILDKEFMSKLCMHGINEENFENRIVPQIITDELEKFYSTLLVSE